MLAPPPTHTHQALPWQQDQGDAGGKYLLSQSQNLSVAGPASPNPAPTQLCPIWGGGGGHRLLQGCSARTVGTLGHAWGFWDGVPWLYLRVRSLFQAWQLMGSSRKLW